MAASAVGFGAARPALVALLVAEADWVRPAVLIAARAGGALVDPAPLVAAVAAVLAV
jgi:hypothetical protein